MREFFSNRKNIYLVSIILGFLLILLIVILTILSTKQKIIKESQKSQVPTLSVKQPPKLDVKSLPQVEFETWTDPGVFTLAPQTARVFDLKTNYTTAQALSFAKKLGITTTEVKENEGLIIIDQREKANPQKGSFMLFESKIGSFTFGTTRGISLKTETNLRDQIQNFVTELTSDQTLSVIASYRKKSAPKITYFEIHRDWVKTGLPIFNPYGLLNVPENQLMRNMSLTGSVPNPLPDADIYQTSDGKNSLKRQDDFNTMTVGVSLIDGQQKVVFVRSNIRPLSTQTLEVAEIITLAEAKRKLENKQYDYVFPAPSGAGSVSYDKVFPAGKAVSKKANIEECIIAYLEQPPLTVQAKLSPAYVCRGFAQLESGYRVNFVAVVSAVKNATSRSKILGAVFAQEQPTPTGDTSQKQGTFELETPAPTTAAPQEPLPSLQQQSAPATAGGCQPTVEEIQPFDIVYQYGAITNAHSTIQYGSGSRWWIWGGTLADYQALKDQLQEQFEQNPSVVPQILGDVESILGQGAPVCPRPASGGSPTLFVYALNHTNVSIDPKFELTYIDYPQGFSREYIYYEYKKVQFEKPDKGWVIEKRGLNDFSEGLADKLGLNKLETERLLFELNHAAQDVSGDRLFVGLIPQSEVDQKLPLSFSREPEVAYRFHFYISRPINSKPNPPTLNSLTRNSSLMILELGAAAF